MFFQRHDRDELLVILTEVQYVHYHHDVLIVNLGWRPEMELHVRYQTNMRVVR